MVLWAIAVCADPCKVDTIHKKKQVKEENELLLNKGLKELVHFKE